MTVWSRPRFLESDSHRRLALMGSRMSSRTAEVRFLLHFDKEREFQNPEPETVKSRWITKPSWQPTWLAEETLQGPLKSSSAVLALGGKFRNPGDLGYLQACLRACRAALAQGACAALDPLAQRWLTTEDFSGRFNPDGRFQVEDHFSVFALPNTRCPAPEDERTGTLLATSGLRKFGRPNLSLFLPGPMVGSEVRAAAVLVNEVAFALAEGKWYTPDDWLATNYPSGRVEVGFYEIPRDYRHLLPSSHHCLLLSQAPDYEYEESDCSEGIKILEHELDGLEPIQGDDILARTWESFARPKLNHPNCQVPAHATNFLLLAGPKSEELGSDQARLLKSLRQR